MGTMDMDGDHLALPCHYPVIYGDNFFCYILIEKIQTFIFVVSLSSHRSRGPSFRHKTKLLVHHVLWMFMKLSTTVSGDTITEVGGRWAPG